MTSALPEGPAGERAADPDMAGTAGTSPGDGRLPAAADDAQQLRAEIERTREQLGSTVEQLVAKVDVKSRARAKATELTERARSATTQAREQAVARAGSVRGKLAGTTADARKKTLAAAPGGTEPLQGLAPQARRNPADPLRHAIAKRAATARQNPVPFAVGAGAAGVLAAVCIVIWQRRRRS